MAKRRRIRRKLTAADNARLAPGAKHPRPGRVNKAKTRLTQKKWDAKILELLEKAPEGSTPAQALEWATKERNRLFRYFAQGKGH